LLAALAFLVTSPILRSYASSLQNQREDLPSFPPPSLLDKLLLVQHPFVSSYIYSAPLNVFLFCLSSLEIFLPPGVLYVFLTGSSATPPLCDKYGFQLVTREALDLSSRNGTPASAVIASSLFFHF